MIKKALTIAVLLSTFTLGACQTTSLYDWGQYDAKLLAYYKDAAHIDAFEAELFALIEQSETSDKRLAPGIFAEYGFIQMQKGDSEAAAKFFDLEKKNWPESKLFMNTMIRAATGKDPVDTENKTESASNES